MGFLSFSGNMSSTYINTAEGWNMTEFEIFSFLLRKHTAEAVCSCYEGSIELVIMGAIEITFELI
jgi:hypothetical protein